jgi:hypothetical protein
MGAVKEKIAELADMAEQILDSGVSDQELDEFMEGQLSPEDTQFYHAHKDIIFNMFGWESEEEDEENDITPHYNRHGFVDNDPYTVDESLMMPKLNEKKSKQTYEDWLDYVYWQIDALLDHDIDEEYTRDLLKEYDDNLREMYDNGEGAPEAAQFIVDNDIQNYPDDEDFKDSKDVDDFDDESDDFEPDEEDEDDGDELSDYEWEVGSALTAQLEDNDIQFDEDNFGDALRDKMEFIRQCMKDGMEPLDCAVELRNDEEFMNSITDEYNDMDEAIKMPRMN